MLDFDERTGESHLLGSEYVGAFAVEFPDALIDLGQAVFLGFGEILLRVQLLSFRRDGVVFGLKLFRQRAVGAFDAAEFGADLIAVLVKDLDPFPAFGAE